MTLRMLTIDTKKAVRCQPKCSSQTQRDPPKLNKRL